MSEKPEAWTAIDSFVFPHIAANLIREQHAENERLRGLLLRIRHWDHLDGAADGSFWKREIDAAMQEDKT
jgi:hypothetical protein